MLYDYKIPCAILYLICNFIKKFNFYSNYQYIDHTKMIKKLDDKERNEEASYVRLFRIT